MKHILAIVFIGGIAFSCTSKKSTTSTTSAKVDKYTVDKSDVERLGTNYPGVTLSELKEGRSLFEANCNLCHGLEKCYSVGEEDLKNIVPGMVKGVNKKKGEGTLNDEEKDKIFHYLVAINTK